MLESSFELRNWVDEFLYKRFKAAAAAASENSSSNKLDLVGGDARFTIDLLAATRMNAFLEENPGITTLMLECNVDREDGAMQILAESIFPKMEELHFYGDYDADGGFTEDDDGTLMECLELACLGVVIAEEGKGSCYNNCSNNNTSKKLVALSLYFAEFRDPHPNCDHLNRILCQASGSLRKLEFQSCLFDPSVSFLTEGLVLQTALEELQASFLFVALSQTFQWTDEQLSHIILALPPCLKVLTLGYHCHMGHQALKALIQWVKDSKHRKCRLHTLDFNGTDDFLSRWDCQIWKQPLSDALRQCNVSLLEIRLGGGAGRDEQQMRRQSEYLRTCIQPTLLRNRCLVQVKRMCRGGAGTCPSAKAGLWACVLATLAAHETALVSATPIYAALTVVSSLLADQQHTFTS